MAFFRNILSSRRVDMEAGNNHSDVELNERETGSGSAHYPQPALSHSPNSDNNFSANRSTISGGIITILLEDRTGKVRVVEQGSKMSTIVRIYLHKI
jgi:hypothetical protein